MSDLSPDERFASYLFIHHTDDIDDEAWEVGIVDLTTGESRTVADLGALYDDLPYTRVGDPVFSPTGEEILFQDGHNLRIGNVATGRTFVVARTINAYDIGYRWLWDGRIAFVSPERRLMFVRPGGRPRATGFRFTNPRGEDDVLRSWDIDPKGEQLLYFSGCGTWLRDLRSGDARFLRAGVTAVPRRSWSPDGRLFLLQSGNSYPERWFNRVCEEFHRPWLLGIQDFLFKRDGKPLTSGKLSLMGHGAGHSHGHDPAWSLDSTWLLFAFQPTGSCVIDFKSLRAIHLGSRTRAKVIPRSLTGRALAGRDGRVVYALWDPTIGTICVSDERDDDYSSGIYVATINK